MNDAEAAIRRCVQVCADARDGRGRWLAERECCAFLESPGATQTVAVLTAAASARLGAWIAQRAAEAASDGVRASPRADTAAD